MRSTLLNFDLQDSFIAEISWYCYLKQNKELESEQNSNLDILEFQGFWDEVKNFGVT